MIKTVKGEGLVPGRLYTFWGKNNTVSWSVYSEEPTLSFFSRKESLDCVKLFPLELFVFLCRTPSELRFHEEDGLYNYKIITSRANVGWLCIHDDDLKNAKICFRECKPYRKK